MGLFKAKRIDIHKHGLAKILGSLEADILEYIWHTGSATARCVCDHLNKSKPLSFNAVNTVLNRLVDKDILKRTRGEQQFEFAARYSKEELCRMVSQDVFSSLLRDKKLFSVAGFAEAFDDLTAKERRDLLRVLRNKKS